jgi:hypothetical protein
VSSIYICPCPRASLYNDTAFLASLGVMDYSLLVGVDRERGQLAGLRDVP